MATVTHGIKDGVDEMIERTAAIDRMLEAMIKPGTSDARVEAITRARAQVSITRTALTSMREAADVLSKTR